MVKAFVTQYEYNQELDMTVRDLEMTRQEYKELFAEFLTRWREKAAKMINRPNEKEQVRMIIKNMQPEYLEKLEFQSKGSKMLFEMARSKGRIKRTNIWG